MRLVFVKEVTKYRLLEPIEWRLREKYNIRHLYEDNEIYLREGGGQYYVGGKVDFRWDGATCWLDHRVILPGSAVHDILCRLIEKGIISEKDNHTIDRELELVVIATNQDYPWYKGGKPVLRIRARAIRRGTNLANSRRTEPEVHTIP